MQKNLKIIMILSMDAKESKDYVLYTINEENG
jgi:hypothetical protein